LYGLIDQELARLPEKFRLPLILCDVEARTYESAAAELNCPLGTLNSRLSRAREKLRGRLLRRGVTLTALAAAAVPPGVASAALQALTQTPTAPVLALAEGVVWSLTLATAKKVTAAVAVFGLLAAGVAAGTIAGQVSPKSAPEVPVAQSNADDKLNFIDSDAGPLPQGVIARIGSTRWRHTGDVTGLAYSPDGKWLASVSTAPEDATARLWDAASGKEKLRVKVAATGNYRQFAAVALGFSADGTQFIVVDLTSLRSFDIANERELFAHRYDRATSVGISPDGKTFVIVRDDRRGGGRGDVRDVVSNGVRKTFAVSHPSPGFAPVSFSPDGRLFIVSVSTNYPLPIFDTESGHQLAQIELGDKRGSNLQFLPGTDVLFGLVNEAPRGTKKSLAFISMKTGEILRTVDGHYTTYALAASPDGKLIVAGNGQRNVSQLIDATTGKEIGRIPSTPSLINLAFSPDGNLLAGARYFGGSITVWDMANRRYHPTAAEPVYFTTTTFSPDGRCLILPGRGRPLVDWRTGRVVRRLADVDTDGWTFSTLSPDAKLFSRPDGDGVIQLLDAESGEEVRSLIGHTQFAAGQTFSRDGRRLASSGQDNVIRVWDVASGRKLTDYAPPELYRSGSLSLSDDGRVLAAGMSGSEGNFVYVWNVDGAAQLARINTPDNSSRQALLSPDGRWLVTGGRYAFVWDATTGQQVHKLTGHEFTKPDSEIACSFSPDSRFLVTGDGVGHLRLWEILSGQEVYHFDGHHSQVSANFSPDGRLLVAASHDAPCFVWHVIGTTVNPQPAAAVDTEQLWHDLADPNARTAFLALRQLVGHPRLAVEVIRKNLKPTAGIDAARVEKLLRDLDSDSFTAREAATAELTKVVEEIEPALHKARSTASPETRTRLDAILEKVAMPSSERLRQSRALAILEYIATPEALKVLDELAAGNKAGRLTTEAAESVQRVRRRGGK
jgi:WD40 repeat protein